MIESLGSRGREDPEGSLKDPVICDGCGRLVWGPHLCEKPKDGEPKCHT